MANSAALPSPTQWYGFRPSPTASPSLRSTDKRNKLVEMKLEVVVIPVSDVDRAKAFYEALGWRLDADFAGGDGLPGRPADAARLGVLDHLRHRGHVGARRARLEGLQLVVYDIDAARAELVARGVDVSELFHDAGGRLPPRRDRGPRGRPGSGARRLRLVRLVQRPGRQRLAAPGDQDPAARAADRTRTTRLTATTFESLTELCGSAAARRGRPRASTRHARSDGTPRTWPDWYASYMVREQPGEELPT